MSFPPSGGHVPSGEVERSVVGNYALIGHYLKNSMLIKMLGLLGLFMRQEIRRFCGHNMGAWQAPLGPRTVIYRRIGVPELSKG